MSLTRHGRHYLLVGTFQWLIDWGTMVLLSHIGLGIRHANVIGRAVGAIVGFVANGKLTFAADDTEVGPLQAARFVAMWIALTFASTLLIGIVDDEIGRKHAWLAKPIVEMGLGLLSFTLSRHWVYRKPRSESDALAGAVAD